jgi:hypothetical protein
MGIHFHRSDPGPGHFSYAWFRDYGLHRPHDTIFIRSTIQQCTDDHIARGAVERIKNKDSHLQYL